MSTSEESTNNSPDHGPFPLPTQSRGTHCRRPQANEGHLIQAFGCIRYLRPSVLAVPVGIDPVPPIADGRYSISLPRGATRSNSRNEPTSDLDHVRQIRVDALTAVFGLLRLVG